MTRVGSDERSAARRRAISAAQWAAYIGTRLTELLLIVIGLGFTLSFNARVTDVQFLAVWDAVATAYLAVGTVVVRHRRGRADPVGYGIGAPRWLRLVRGPRFNFAFTLATSLVGLSSAAAVLAHGKDTSIGQDIKLLGALAIVCAWLLLHAGYARFYSGLYNEVGGQGRPMDFPRTEQPSAVDFMYFSFTLGSSFAVSDVTVVAASMRWHVMVHSVLSFFYNAIVLALAIGIVTTL